MADLFQGAPLPTITTTQQTQTTTPDFYNNYLQDVANLGQNAVTQGGVAGFSPLQQQAFQMAPNAAFSGANTTGEAATMTKAAGLTGAPAIVGNYMNPYTRNVVDEMERLQQQNIQRNVMPALAGAGVGTGSFGSKRQATATGQTLADMQANLLGQEYNALNTGYNQAMTAAGSDLNRELQAGQTLGNIGTEQYNIGTGGLNTLSTLGATEQAQGQKVLDYPMLQAQNYAKLFPITIPTGQTQQYTGPGSSGQYANSPLSQIAGLMAGLGSFLNAGSSTTGSTSTTPAATTNPYNLDVGTINMLKSLGNTALTSVLGLKDGGDVGYADGGTVKPFEMPAHMHKHFLLTRA